MGMLVVMFFLVYQEYEYTYTREERVIESTKLAENELTKSLYLSFKRDAQEKVDRVAKEVREGLIDSYGTDIETFANDYNNPTEQSVLVTSIDKAISDEDNRFFYVESDSNDMFALSKNQILADQSTDCSIEGESARILESEIGKHFNKHLAKQSMESLISGKNNNIFWQYTNHAKAKKPRLRIMDINKVLALPLEELKDYEFLTVSYIDKYGDILGVDDISNMGVKNDSKKLMIVQGFNLYEQVEQDFKPSYTRLHKNQKMQLAIIEESRKGLFSKVVLMMALIIISFFAMAVIQNKFVKGCGVDVKHK